MKTTRNNAILKGSAPSGTVYPLTFTVEVSLREIVDGVQPPLLQEWKGATDYILGQLIEGRAE